MCFNGEIRKLHNKTGDKQKISTHKALKKSYQGTYP